MDPIPTLKGLGARRLPYAGADITLVVAVRAHGSNPWVLPRVRMLAGHYDPMPAVVVADLGSQGRFREELEQCCAEHGFNYTRIDDDGVYSAAVARNRGAEAATTDLLFFCDVDCFGESDLFARLAKHANDIQLGECFDQLVVLPAYHLTHEATGAALALQPRDRGHFLAKAMAAAVFGPRNNVVEYVDPFSNFLLCRRDFFSFVGGYNESFRGHGSEDFEFLLRCAAETRQLPLPKGPAGDHFAPIRNGFFSNKKPYTGFRRLGELMAYPAEAAGLRIAHLHHERCIVADSWYAKHDVLRARLKRQALPYLQEPSVALSYDWITRTRSALVVLGRGRAACDLAMPLRACGYRLTPWVVDGPEALDGLVAAAACHDEVVVVEPGLSGTALAAGPLAQLAVDRSGWVISAGTNPGEFVYRRYVRGGLTFEGTAAFRACRTPAVEGTREPGWLFEELPFGVPTVGRAGALRLFAGSSYASGKLQLALCRDDVEAKPASSRAQAPTLRGQLLARRLRKFLRNPTRFLLDSRFAVLRVIGGLLLGRSQLPAAVEDSATPPATLTTRHGVLPAANPVVRTH